jgi:glycosyltransferase involved in cell wall biosynthesis
MMNNGRPSDDNTKRIEALERRIAELEDQSQSAVFALTILRRGLRRSFVQPPLWKFGQYSPRTINLPGSYTQQIALQRAPSIAMVTPSYNQEAYLRATIDSILNQNYPALDYVVEDGGSDDGSVEVLRSYGEKLRWSSDGDNGQGDAINRGFRKVTGEIMGYLNSDDVLLSGTLAYVAQAFLDHPDIDIVYGHRIYIDEEGYDIGRCVLPAHNSEMLKWADYVPQETMFWRRRVWDKVGPFNESYRYALDWDFILRAQAEGFKFLRLPRFLACFRVHGAQKTTALRDVGKREMNLLREQYLGHRPSGAEIARTIKGYLIRQLFYHWSYRLGFLKH